MKIILVRNSAKSLSWLPTEKNLMLIFQQKVSKPIFSSEFGADHFPARVTPYPSRKRADSDCIMPEEETPSGEPPALQKPNNIRNGANASNETESLELRLTFTSKRQTIVVVI